MNKDININFIKDENKNGISYEEIKDISHEVLYSFKCELNLCRLLLDCCIENNYKLAKTFIDWGVDIKYTTDIGFTFLMIACTHNSYECVKLLIESGVDVNRESIFEDTALDIAKRVPVDKRIVDLLIQNGAHE